MTGKKHRRTAPITTPTFETARFALEFRRSKIEGFGIYAKEDIPARKLAIEYTGEKISEKQADRRYEKEPRGPTPMRTFSGLGAPSSMGRSAARVRNTSTTAARRT
jgi:hypothetical protein